MRRTSGAFELRASDVLRENVTGQEASTVPGELLAAARSALTWYKVPHEVTVVPSLPRNPTGKLPRRGLRALAASPSGAPQSRRCPSPERGVKLPGHALWAYRTG